MGVGRDGRVIDLHVLTGREGLVITLVGLVITPSHSHRLSLGMPASLTNLGLLAAMVRTNGTLGRDWQPAGQHAGEFVWGPFHTNPPYRPPGQMTLLSRRTSARMFG